MICIRAMLFLIAIMLPSGTIAEGASKDAKVNAIVVNHMLQHRIPGLPLAIVSNGTVVKSEGYGLAEIENLVPAKTETVYRIESLSKQFIAMGIMLLLDHSDPRFRVNLDDKASLLVGNNLCPRDPDRWREITVRQLLNHTSGVVRGVRQGPQDSLSDVIGKSCEVAFTPGKHFQYSNLGYFVLA